MTKQKVLIATDHAGVDLKDLILKSDQFKDIEFINLGTDTTDSVDYPDYAKNLCTALLDGKATFGILICGSGIGMSIQANRFKGIRAALCWNVELATLSKKHNNANILCLGAKVTDHRLALDLTRAWFDTAFEGGRHQRRVDKMG